MKNQYFMESITQYSLEYIRVGKIAFSQVMSILNQLSQEKTGIRITSNRNEESLDITPRMRRANSSGSAIYLKCRVRLVPQRQ